jgi:N-acetylneuraminate lyase
MDHKGDLNLDQISTLVQLYEQNGVNGAFICGSTGEGVSLSHEEKKEVVEAWGKEKGHHVKTIFMLGGTCLKEMQQLAELAQEHNMDAISILCPYYFRPSSVAHLVDFCKKVTDAAPEMPFYYYHIPALTGGNYSMLEFLKLADDLLPNLAGIKFTSPDLYDFQSCTLYKGGKYNMLWGTDEALLSGLAAGADGATGSTYNYAAPIYNRVIEAFEKGDMPEARKAQLLAVQMVQILIKYGGIGAGKAFMKLIGVDCGWFRAPIIAPTEDAVKAMKKELEEIGFFTFCNTLS